MNSENLFEVFYQLSRELLRSEKRPSNGKLTDLKGKSLDLKLTDCYIDPNSFVSVYKVLNEAGETVSVMSLVSPDLFKSRKYNLRDMKKLYLLDEEDIDQLRSYLSKNECDCCDGCCPNRDPEVKKVKDPEPPESPKSPEEPLKNKVKKTEVKVDKNLIEDKKSEAERIQRSKLEELENHIKSKIKESKKVTTTDEKDFSFSKECSECGCMICKRIDVDPYDVLRYCRRCDIYEHLTGKDREKLDIIINRALRYVTSM